MNKTANKARAANTPSAATRESDDARPTVSPWIENTLESVEEYAREQPWNFGLCMLGIGFVLGWKMKLW